MNTKMKHTILAVILAMGVGSAHAAPVTINDGYVGASPTHPSYYGQDVIGSTSWFSIDKMTVDFSSSLTIDIYSTYFDNVGQYSTSLGDLFISTDGWNPYGSAPYNDDKASNGESWEYALVMSNHGEGYSGSSMLGASGGLSLYAVSPANIQLSTAPTGYIYRAGQEVSLLTDGLEAISTNGTWSVIDLAGGIDILRLTLNYGLLFEDDTVGFHWAFSCANDVIEGEAAVPEPATMLLLASGLLGGAFVRRRRR